MYKRQPEILSKIAGELEEGPYDIFDINMGCPVPKKMCIRDRAIDRIGAACPFGLHLGQLLFYWSNDGQTVRMDGRNDGCQDLTGED